jgi:hypothetical protein
LLFDGPIGQVLDRQRPEVVVKAERPGDLATVAALAAEAGHYTADGRFLRVQAPASFAR